MLSIGLVLSVGIIVLLIKYLLKTSNVLATTLLYAGSFFTISLLFSLGNFQPIVLVILVVKLLYDLATGYVYFWLIDRFQDNYFLFYLTIILGILINGIIRIFLLNF